MLVSCNIKMLDFTQVGELHSNYLYNFHPKNMQKNKSLDNFVKF